MESENTEIVFQCNSLNNKNVRANELKILEKRPGELYFVFGENATNVKKRFYEDEKTLNKDFEELKKIKQNLEKSKNQKAEKADFDFHDTDEGLNEGKKDRKSRKEVF